MKNFLPLLMKNVLLLLLCSLTGALSSREFNDLSRQTRFTTSLDSDLRRNPALKSTQPQPWHSHSPSDGVSEEDSTSNSQPGTVGDLIDSTQEEDSTVRSLSSQERNGNEEDKAVGEERRGKEDETLFGQTTSVYMPTYFSYGTTRRANSRDRVNANRNLRNNNHEVERNSTSFVNFRNANNVGKNSTTSVNNTRSSSTSSVDDTRIEGTGDQKYGWKNSRTVFNGRSNIQENNGTTTSSANTGRSRENSDIGDTTSRRNRYETNVRVTPTLTSNQPTMTYSSDILKLTSPKHSTFGRRANSTDSNYFIKSTTQLPSTNDEVPSSIKSTSFVENPRGGRILTGRRKVNGDESTGVDYLERIQQQIQASTFRPTSYHDEDKNLEYKKKPIKKDTDDVGIVLGGGKGGEKLHVKESAKTETQKAAEVWDEKYKHLKESKDLGKIKEVITQKPIVDEGYSTIIDTLSKGSGHVPQIIESQKNVTINNEPGTNLLETENVGLSKETNEKRETKEKDDESGGDVIPVIIKNSVVGESVNDSLNKSVNFRYPSDVKSGNESLFLSSTLGTNVESEKTENLQTNEKMDLGKHVEVEKDDQEIKKKVYNLKKPLLPPNGGKVDDGFEVMLKNGSADSNDDVVFFSSSVPSLELNKTGINRIGIIDGEKEREEGNRLQKTRISSSTSRITSSFSSNKLASITQHEYTTFASNNLENNIITTSSPLLHGFTSTTPRVKHFFSMRTTTTVQSQPEGNSIKQISSFNPRKRPAVTHYQTTQANPLESHEVEESSTEMHSTKKVSYSSTAGYLSSTSMRTDTFRKIVPWSTRLQKTTTMPETTTMDYSDETTLSNKASSFGFADWSKSTPASGDISAVPPTFSTTYSIPTATHVTSETPSWTSVSYSSRTTSRSLEGISSETDSPVLAASGTTSNSSGPPGRLAGSSDTSFNPGRATITYLEKITVPTASSQSFSITTAQLPTSSVEVSSGSSQEKSTSTATSTSDTSVNSSVRWQSTTESGYTSNYPEKSNSSTISIYPSSNSTVTWGIGDTTRDLQANNKIVVESTFEPSTDDLVTRKSDDMFNTTTWSSYGDKNSTEDLQFGDGGGWKSTTAGQDLGTTAREDSSTTAGQDLGTTVRPDLSTTAGQDIGKTAEQDLGTTAGQDFGTIAGQDLDTTAGQDLGTIAGQDLSTTGGQDSGSTTEETCGGSEEQDDAITTSRPRLTLKSEVNLASTAGMTTPRPYPTSNNNSISKQMFTYRPHSTSNSQPSLTSILSTNLTKLIFTSRPHTTSNSNPNITSILSTNLTSTSKPHETEDFFETDDEELHTTTTFPTEGGEYEHGVEDEDDRAMAQTTIKPNKDNRIIQNGSKEEVTTERNNFIMKIPTTESTTWTTDFGEEATTAVRTLPSRADDIRSTTPSSVPIDTEKPTPMQRPIIPVTIEPELATTKPQYMGVSLLIKGSTLQDICNAQHSLKRAIMFLFRNTTGRVLHEDQIVFPSLTSEECNGAKALNSGFHNVDLMLFDENGNLDDELNSEFRMLWENNGLRTNIAIHDVYLILRPTEDEQTSGMTIAVIVIACIGLTCLLLFFILMMVLRKRQKKFNYGQRCTPVSLDDYSLDNISVYNSMRRKNARRASKRSYGNPAFDDPSAPSHQMNFAALAHFCSNRSAIDDEFGDIPMLGAKMDELPPGAETRNRYANVIPLPETRVQLTVRDGDDPVTGYINANYVKGPKGAPKFYIACQAPMQSTVNDFWRMIWEQQSKLILMLTDLYENGVEKCFDYLPPSEVLDCHRLFGDYQVTLKKREVREKYVISHLQLKNLDSNLWREVTHLWYTSWPHQGTPSEGASMIAYLIEARAYMRHSSGPHIVHCSPGVGRTGTVLAIDLCIREFETSRMVDVPKTVYGLRRNRAGCVQTKDQYAFIYMVLNVYGTKLTGGALDSM